MNWIKFLKSESFDYIGSKKICMKNNHAIAIAHLILLPLFCSKPTKSSNTQNTNVWSPGIKAMSDLSSMMLYLLLAKFYPSTSDTPISPPLSGNSTCMIFTKSNNKIKASSSKTRSFVKANNKTLSLSGEKLPKKSVANAGNKSMTGSTPKTKSTKTFWKALRNHSRLKSIILHFFMKGPFNSWKTWTIPTLRNNNA